MSKTLTTRPDEETTGEKTPSPNVDDVVRGHLLGALRALTPASGMTYEEFLNWADEDTLAEWVRGEIVMTSTESVAHQELASMGTFVETRKLGEVIMRPFQMKLADSGRAPDLFFIATDHLDRLTMYYLDGPADLVVEITSPESVGRDRGDKFYEYEAGGVPEYWLIDPQRRWAEFYRLEQERYHLTHAGAEGVVRSNSIPDFWLRVEWLWQQPLPPIFDLLRELGITA